MNILVVVGESPWGSSLASVACRFVHAALEAGHAVPAVFFHADGVYHAFAGRSADDGLPGPQELWRQLGLAHHFELLLCSAAAARRVPAAAAGALAEPYREAGLVELFALMKTCDRLVSF